MGARSIVGLAAVAILLTASAALRSGGAAGEGAAESRMSLRIARVQAPAAWLEDLHLELHEQGADASLRLRIVRLRLVELGLAGALDWSCALRRDSAGRDCAGPLLLRGAGGQTQNATFKLHLERGALRLEFSSAAAKVVLQLPFDAGVGFEASAQNVPARWLRGPLGMRRPGAVLTDGEFDLALRRDAAAGIKARFRLARLGLSDADSGLALEGFGASGELDYAAEGEGARLSLRLGPDSGRVTGGALHLELASMQATATLEARIDAAAHWRVEHFQWRDGDTLDLAGSAEFDDGRLRLLEAAVRRARLPLVAERYAAGSLAELGLAEVDLRGEVSGELRLVDGALERVLLRTPGLDIEDPRRGLTLSSLRGTLDWRVKTVGEVTSFGWRRAEIGGVALGASQGRWQIQQGRLRLAAPLAVPLPAGELGISRLTIDPSLRGDWLQAAFTLADAAWDRSDGRFAGAGLGLAGEVEVSGPPASPRLRGTAKVSGGEVLFGPVYVRLPQSGLQASLDLELQEASWLVHSLRWDDPGVLSFTGEGRFDARDRAPLRLLRLRVDEAQLGPALARYGASWLDARGWAGLEASGRFGGDVLLDDQGLQRLALTADGVTIADPSGRISLRQLGAKLHWEADHDAEPGVLSWGSLEILGIPFGPAHLRLASREGALTLLEPQAIDVLGGEFRLRELSLLPRSPRGERYAASFAIAGIDMRQLSALLGWPAFAGNLSGGVPEIELSGNTLHLGGGLDLYAFDGHVGLDSVRVERPFGVAPSLSANVHFQDLDLEQLTSAFSFGQMQGRLMGSIVGLRLVDWSPVAFDAWLHTRGGGRMSYKAVDDIAAVGGGGLSGGLQTLALRWFDSFGYRRLGLRCRLRDEICRMAGIEPADAAEAASGAGYTMVEGSGVPQLMIVGHRRQVDWPTLLRRLQEATSGAGPVVR